MYPKTWASFRIWTRYILLRHERVDLRSVGAMVAR